MRKQTNNNRSEKIASKVQTLVGQILRDSYSEDKLLSGVSLTGSESHGGLSFVKLFYYSRSDDTDSVQKRLDDNLKTIRFELAQKLNQKSVPNLRFIYDDSLDRATRIEKLLENI